MVNVEQLSQDLYGVSLNNLVLLFMIVLSRIGGCLMTMPVISSARIPAKIRLFFAISFTLIVIPLVKNQIIGLLGNLSIASLLAIIAEETLLGCVMGLTAHVFFQALQFMASIIVTSLGLGTQVRNSIIETDTDSVLGELLIMTGLVLFFSANLHLTMLKGLVTSYQSIPVTFVPNTTIVLKDYSEAVENAFWVLFRITAPFIVYSMFVNICVGLLNKMTPMIPIYFISTIFVGFLGTLLLYLLIPEILDYFSAELTNWITRHM